MANNNPQHIAEVVPLRFAGTPEQDFKKAKIALLPVGYDATTTFKSGSRDGPMAILQASMQLDEPWGDYEPWHPMVREGFFYTFEHNISLAGGSTKEHLDSLCAFVRKGVVTKGKIPFLLGGEHSLAYATITAVHEKEKNFSILHFDAHTDLRPDYHGDLYSHSAVLRRSFELGPKVSLTSVGVRSVDRDVRKFITEQEKKNTSEKSLNMFYAPELPEDAIEKTLKKNVYITFDLDVFDSSVMPALGTPQPGGLQWYPVISLLEYVIARHNIIGMDVVELAPIPGMVAPDFAAAKLVWKMMEMAYNSQKNRHVI
ncbi:MAG: agmatinase [Candidatus Sungbacteria bacterium]|nr:agmatinase [Candidatus Sungbacteria bacterium]